MRQNLVRLRLLVLLVSFPLLATNSRGQTHLALDLQPSAIPTRKISGFEGNIEKIAQSNDLSRLIIADESKHIYILNHNESNAVFSLVGHTDFISSISISNDNKFLLSASLDHTMKLWDLEGRVQRFQSRIDTCFSIAISPDQKTIASGHDNKVCFWDFDNLSKRKDYPIKGTGRLLVFSRDGGTLALVDYIKRLSFLDTRTGSLRMLNSGHQGLITGSGFIRNDKMFMTASSDHHLKIWDVSDGHLEKNMHQDSHFGCLDRIYAVGYSESTNRAITYSHDNHLRVWDMSLGRLVRNIRLNLEDYEISLRQTACFSRSNDRLIVGTRHGVVLIFDIKASFLNED
jgi:WD40 repeat protein